MWICYNLSDLAVVLVGIVPKIQDDVEVVREGLDGLELREMD